MAMNRSSVAYLVNESYTKDDYGVQRRATEKRKIYCNVTSVTGTEWFEGGRNGLNPRYRITMFNFDYLGEKIIEYNGVQYTIYRTYNRSVDEIELYVELRKGNESNGESES